MSEANCAATAGSVSEITPERMGDFAFCAKRENPMRGDMEFLGSDSLPALKREVKNRGWRLAWLTTNRGAFSYGQRIVDEYPYQPRY